MSGNRPYSKQLPSFYRSGPDLGLLTPSLMNALNKNAIICACAQYQLSNSRSTASSMSSPMSPPIRAIALSFVCLTFRWSVGQIFQGLICTAFFFFALTVLQWHKLSSQGCSYLSCSLWSECKPLILQISTFYFCQSAHKYLHD